MREWLRNLFAPKPCPTCAALQARSEVLKEAYEGWLRDLRNELEFSKAETIKFQEALFRVSRISAVNNKPGPSEGAKMEGVREFSGSHRNWKDVRSSLERSHRKVEADAKAAYWAQVNAKAESEIPELRDALKGEVGKVEFNEDIEELSK